jgi:hypothetical protein
MIVAALPLVLVAVLGSGIAVTENVVKVDETPVVQSVDQHSASQPFEELEAGYKK